MYIHNKNIYIFLLLSPFLALFDYGLLLRLLGLRVLIIKNWQH